MTNLHPGDEVDPVEAGRLLSVQAVNVAARSLKGDYRWASCSIKEFGHVGKYAHIVSSGSLSSLCGHTATHASIWRGDNRKPRCAACTKEAQRREKGRRTGTPAPRMAPDPAPEPEPDPEPVVTEPRDRRTLRQASGETLLRTFAALTHQLHACRESRGANSVAHAQVLKQKRDIVRTEILRRMRDE